MREGLLAQTAMTQPPDMVWTAGEDALLAMGIRQLGTHAHDAIAATLLPTWSGAQVQERWKHMSHHNKRDNIIKVSLHLFIFAAFYSVFCLHLSNAAIWVIVVRSRQCL